MASALLPLCQFPPLSRRPEGADTSVVCFPGESVQASHQTGSHRIWLCQGVQKNGTFNPARSGFLSSTSLSLKTCGIKSIECHVDLPPVQDLPWQYPVREQPYNWLGQGTSYNLHHSNTLAQMRARGSTETEYCCIQSPDYLVCSP